MLSNNAILNASIIETPEGEENIIQLSTDGSTYLQSDVKWVLDYRGPTGVPTKFGLIEKSNLRILEIQKNNYDELVLHYIQKPQ